MKNNQINLTIEKQGIKTNFTANIRKGILEHFQQKGFKILSVQY